MKPSLNSITRTQSDIESLAARRMPVEGTEFANYHSVSARLLPALKCGLAGLVAALAVLLSGGCQTGSTGPYPKQWDSPTPGALAPGDIVKLSFPGAPELNQLQKIRPDGKISLPTIGEMSVSGKRLGDLQRELSRRYSSEIKNSEVIVTLEFSAIPVYVSGTVKSPGKVVLDRPMTAFEAILEAGGFADFANTKKVVLIRNVNGRHTTYILNLSPSLKGKPSEAFYLKAYDAIYVP